MPEFKIQPWSGEAGRVQLKELEWRTVYTSGDAAHYRVAFIPPDRLQDLINGHGFEEGALLVKKMGGACFREANIVFRDQLRFYCVHGPEDHTVGLETDDYVTSVGSRPSQGKGSRPRSKRAKGKSRKMGCKFGFEVRSFKLNKHVLKIRQVLWKGSGHSSPLHCDACGERSKTVIGEGMSSWARGLLQQWFVCEPDLRLHRAVDRLRKRTVARAAVQYGYESTLEAERAMVEKRIPFPSDYAVDTKAVANVKVKFAKLEWKRHEDVRQSVAVYAYEYAEIIWVQSAHKGDGEMVPATPFVLVIMADHQEELLERAGVGDTVLIDSTHGTNVNNFSLFTLMVINTHGRGRPVAWFITSDELATTIQQALECVKHKAREWKPKTFMSDCSDAEMKAVTAVFPGIKIHLCIWHVKRAWLKNLCAHVSGDAKERLRLRADIMDDLNNLVAWKPKKAASEDTVRQEGDTMFTNFAKKWDKNARCKSFVKYFMAEWNGKKENVMKAFRVRSGKGVHTNNALEGYHAAIKSRFLDRKSTRGARLDWLLHVLLDVVMPHYQKMQALEDSGIRDNKHLEKQTMEACIIAKAIPEDGVKVIREGMSTRLSQRFSIQVTIPTRDKKQSDDEDEGSDRGDETSTVTGIAGEEVGLQEFTNELQCDCYAGLEGSVMCPCRVVAAKKYKPAAIAMWLGHNVGGAVRRGAFVIGRRAEMPRGRHRCP